MPEYTRLHVDERPPKPPLADDPTFMASLSDLDHGLIDDPDPAVRATPPSPPPPPRPHSPAFSGPPRLTSEASAALAAASAALAAFDAPRTAGAAPNASAGRTRPDAFPPANPAIFPANSLVPETRDPVDQEARDPGLLPEAEAPARGSFWRGRLLMVVLMIALMLAGAAGAGWIFRGPLERALTRWHVLR